VTKNFEPENSRAIAKVREGLPRDYSFFDPVIQDQDLEGAASLLGMALSCAGMILHLGSGVFLKGDGFNHKACCWRERSQQLPKVYHSGPILMSQNLVASYKYPSVTRKVLM
jgi:hypothetical protein